MSTIGKTILSAFCSKRITGWDSYQGETNSFNVNKSILKMLKPKKYKEFCIAFREHAPNLPEQAYFRESFAKTQTEEHAVCDGTVVDFVDVGTVIDVAYYVTQN